MDAQSETKITELFEKLRGQFGGVAERTPGNEKLRAAVTHLDSLLATPGGFEGAKREEAAQAIDILQDILREQGGKENVKAREAAARLQMKLEGVMEMLYPTPDEKLEKLFTDMRAHCLEAASLGGDKSLKEAASAIDRTLETPGAFSETGRDLSIKDSKSKKETTAETLTLIQRAVSKAVGGTPGEARKVVVRINEKLMAARLIVNPAAPPPKPKDPDAPSQLDELEKKSSPAASQPHATP